MEIPTVSGLRSRSRSKTPFLRSSIDRENGPEVEEGTQQKSGRKTPIKRSTPIKQLSNPSKVATETITEVTEEYTSPLAHRTRHATRAATDKLVKTSDYSSEESLDRLKGHGKEVIQNEINSQYERVSTSSHTYSVLDDVTLSPIQTSYNVTRDRSTRFGSPAYSACSTDSSFAEQALADTSTLLNRDPSGDHLPSRLYKMAGEYWNKYPKTDYTYSPLSKDRVELAPGQVAMPNMSRRSLSQFRVQGPSTSVDEIDRLSADWTSTSLRQRYASADNSDDESPYQCVKGSVQKDQRWLLTRLLVSIASTLSSYTRAASRRVFGPDHRYPYTDRRPAKAGLLTSAASVTAAPFYWIYTVIKTIITTTITTITETITPSHAEEREKYISRSYKQKPARRWWPWLLLLLLPALGYGCYNYADRILPLIPERPIAEDTYKSPLIVQDSALNDRVMALETWAGQVDSRLKSFDLKLSRFNDLEAQIETYSLKYLQQNIIQVLNADNSEALAAKLKRHFDQYYITSEQAQAMSAEIHERFISAWTPDLDEDKIRQVVQEYLAVFERRQLEVITERVRQYVAAAPGGGGDGGGGGGFDPDAVRKLVAGMLDVYDADKTGLVDYALESAGGQVISTKCTELYQIKTKQYSILGLPVWWVYTSPRFALTPGAMPAECWAFQGFPGYLVIRTYAIIEVTGFSLEHMSRLLAADGKIESAPRNFSVYGLHGELDPEPHHFGDYMYDANGTAIQYFPVQHAKTTDIDGVQYPVAFDIVELRVETNHGNPTYTCVYRLRVHGNPLADVRRATADTMADSDT